MPYTTKEREKKTTKLNDKKIYKKAKKWKTVIFCKSLCVCASHLCSLRRKTVDFL